MEVVLMEDFDVVFSYEYLELMFQQMFLSIQDKDSDVHYEKFLNVDILNFYLKNVYYNENKEMV
jgi:hypothetical protein